MQKNRPPRKFGPSSGRPSFGAKPRFPRKDGDGDGHKPRRFDRDDAARPARPSGDRKPRFGKEDRPRNERSDSFGERSARPPRRFDRDQESRPARSFDERKPRFAGKESAGEDRKPRRFDRDGSDRPARSFDERKPRFDKFDKKDRPERKSFDSKRPSGKSFEKGPRSTSAPHEKKRPTPSRTVDMRPAGDQGLMLWGLHAVREALLNPQRTSKVLWATESGLAALQETIAKASKSGLKLPEPTLCDRGVIDRLLPRDTVHQGVALSVTPLPELSLDDLLGQSEGPSLIVVLDQVTDPHNVGAILRSAAAFGAGAVIVTERNAPSATGIMAKTACGATEHVPVISVVNLARALEALKAESFWCVGLAEEGEKSLEEAKLNSGRIALILGAEGEGLRRLTREHCDQLCRLPTQGAIGSLNVSNAAAVALYEAKRQKDQA